MQLGRQDGVGRLPEPAGDDIFGRPLYRELEIGRLRCCRRRCQRHLGGRPLLLRRGGGGAASGLRRRRRDGEATWFVDAGYEDVKPLAGEELGGMRVLVSGRICAYISKYIYGECRMLGLADGMRQIGPAGQARVVLLGKCKREVWELMQISP